MEVTRDSPAAKAGLKPGDVIVKINNQEIREAERFKDVLAQKKVGDKVTLRVLRDGKEQELTATLNEFPRRPEEREPGRPPLLGVHAEILTPELKSRLNIEAESGMVVMDVRRDSAADRAGLKRNDVITAVNGAAVKNAMDLREAFRKAGTGKEVTLQILRGKEKMSLKATLR